MKIRLATEYDAEGALAIYAQYINTPITFEYTLPAVEEFTRRIQTTLVDYPYLVCCESDRVCGYAYAHRLQEREAYQWGAELSVYLDAGITARGIGKALYRTLIELLKQQGVRTVYGCVTVPNPRSEKLHERMGFHRSGDWKRAGFKDGAWHDVAWFEKEIAPCDVPPQPITPFSRLTPEQLRAALELNLLLPE